VGLGWNVLVRHDTPTPLSGSLLSLRAHVSHANHQRGSSVVPRRRPLTILHPVGTLIASTSVIHLPSHNI
jgi:hypothetical protein